MAILPPPQEKTNKQNKAKQTNKQTQKQRKKYKKYKPTLEYTRIKKSSFTKSQSRIVHFVVIQFMYIFSFR